MSKERKKQKVEVWLPVEFVERIDRAAATTDLSRASFVRMAISSYLRKWQAPARNSELHEPCSLCGKRHDKAEHYAE